MEVIDEDVQPSNSHVTFRDPPRKRIKELLGACIDSAQGLRVLGQRSWAEGRAGDGITGLVFGKHVLNTLYYLCGL